MNCLNLYVSWVPIAPFCCKIIFWLTKKRFKTNFIQNQFFADAISFITLKYQKRILSVILVSYYLRSTVNPSIYFRFLFTVFHSLSLVTFMLFRNSDLSAAVQSGELQKLLSAS